MNQYRGVNSVFQLAQVADANKPSKVKKNIEKLEINPELNSGRAPESDEENPPEKNLSAIEIRKVLLDTEINELISKLADIFRGPSSSIVTDFMTIAFAQEVADLVQSPNKLIHSPTPETINVLSACKKLCERISYLRLEQTRMAYNSFIIDCFQANKSKLKSKIVTGGFGISGALIRLLGESDEISRLFFDGNTDAKSRERVDHYIRRISRAFGYKELNIGGLLQDHLGATPDEIRLWDIEKSSKARANFASGDYGGYSTGKLLASERQGYKSRRK